MADADEDDDIRFVCGYQKPNVERHFAEDDETVRQLAQNDPAIAGLTVMLLTHDSNWTENLGRAISKSNHLRDLVISGRFTKELQSFFVWLANNRSIESLFLLGFNDSFDIFEVLAPFFEHNDNFRSIEMGTSNISKSISTLISILSKSKMNHLARIELGECNIGDEIAAELINALNGMKGLHNLLDLDLHENKIYDKGCEALSVLLTNSECGIQVLNLSNNLLDDNCLGLLIIQGLVKNDTLKSLSIGNQRLLTNAGWKMFTSFLSNPMCSLEKIVLEEEKLDCQRATSLANSLTKNKTLKCLDFDRSRMPPPAWQIFANSLNDPSSVLLELNLSGCNINDASALDIFSGLANNISLKTLIINSVDGITSSGWVACIQLLVDSLCTLMVLDLEFNTIDDEGASVLAHLLTNLNTITSVNLWENSNVSPDGWHVFSQVLIPSSTSKLKRLTIGHCEEDNEGFPIMNDNVVSDFVTALAKNSCLEKLDIGDVEELPISLNTLVSVLCNTESISSILQSNHTLYNFTFNGSDDMEYPSELDALLDLNDDEDKGRVIRKKLLGYFFSDVDNIGRTFGPMATSVMPNAMEWISRDDSGYTVLFEFCRIMPTLFKGA